jgi:uncharacterized protein YbaA (DUF1428 family)
MSHYVDGFVLPVPIRNLDAYRQMAELTGKVWKEHGALQYWECIADDVQPGKLTSFPQSVQLKEDETVVFSWIVYESREHRDSVNVKVMADRASRTQWIRKPCPSTAHACSGAGSRGLSNSEQTPTQVSATTQEVVARLLLAGRVLENRLLSNFRSGGHEHEQ